MCFIAPNSPLPTITDSALIDGYSQPGAKQNTLATGNNAVLEITLYGGNAGTGADGLRITAANSTVKGLDIYAFSNQGIDIRGTGATGNKVQGNYIASNRRGVVLAEGASGNAIGSTTPAARNTLFMNTFTGLTLSGTSNNLVQNNYVGTNTYGNSNSANGLYGVEVFGGSQDNTIGGTSSSARNVISGTTKDASGNGGHGVRIADAGSTGNRVSGNYIGTDATGKKVMGNAREGVLIDGASNNTIGGTTAGAGNIISGNNSGGVDILGSGASGNKVQGNHIGTDKTGTLDLGSFNGVFISYAPGNTVGGTEAGARNVIAFNDFTGVLIFGDSATGNSVLSNSVFSNAELGIDLNTDGATRNDNGPPPDGDFGPNNLQNYPVLYSAKASRRATTVQGTLNSTPNQTFTLQFFGSPSADPSGFGEGQRFLGQKVVSTDPSGNASFTFKTKKKTPKGQVVTATATDPGGNTSEFSATRAVQ